MIAISTSFERRSAWRWSIARGFARLVALGMYNDGACLRLCLLLLVCLFNRSSILPFVRSFVCSYITFVGLLFVRSQGRHLRGAGGPSPPPPIEGKRKKKKRKKKQKKREKREKKKKKKKERKKGTMNNVKLLHIKCCFFQFFNSRAALKIKKNFVPQEKFEMTPMFVRSFVRCFIRSFFRSFVPSFVHSFVRSFIRSFVRSFIRSILRLFFRLFVRPSVYL